MEFFRRAAARPGRLGVLAGTFNPPTRAHLALARAALERVDEVVFVLPRALPHKAWDGAAFEDRIRMLELALAAEPRFSIATARGGLFIEIARECREAYGSGVEIFFLCGRDAAERVANWDYGSPGAFADQLREFQLLVAPRGGAYPPPAELRGRVHPLPMPGEYDECSATGVRERIRSDRPWKHLVPPEIADLVRETY